MANRWVRGPSLANNAGAADNYQASQGVIVLLYYTFRYLLGYQFIDEGIAGAPTSWTDCTQATAADGILTATDFTFAVASGTPFTLGTDEGKTILIVDATNPENCGIHKIVSVDAGGTFVTLDWYSSDFPTAASGLTWYLIDDTAADGVTHGDFFVFQVNHATVPWQFACTLFDEGGDDRVKFEFAPEVGSWNTGTNAWNATAPLLARALKPGMSTYTDPATPRLYVYGDTEGSALWFMFHKNDGTGAKSYAGAFVMDPLFETTPVHSARDKLVIHGYTQTIGNDGKRNGDVAFGIDYGSVWIDDPYPKSAISRWCGWYDNTVEYFKRAFTSPNHREGSEFDALPIWIQADADVSPNPQWSIVGALPSSHIFLTACNGIGDLTPFGSNLFMHWTEGIATPWPGLQHT